MSLRSKYTIAVAGRFGTLRYVLQLVQITGQKQSTSNVVFKTTHGDIIVDFCCYLRGQKDGIILIASPSKAYESFELSMLGHYSQKNTLIFNKRSGNSYVGHTYQSPPHLVGKGVMYSTKKWDNHDIKWSFQLLLRSMSGIDNLYIL